MTSSKMTTSILLTLRRHGGVIGKIIGVILEPKVMKTYVGNLAYRLRFQNFMVDFKQRNSSTCWLQSRISWNSRWSLRMGGYLWWR